MATATETNGTANSKIPDNIPVAAHPLAEDPTDIASNIKYHAQYSTHFSPIKFEPEQAYFASAESVHDRLVQAKT